MGANIYWRPIKDQYSFSVDHKSSFIAAMEKGFGLAPWSLGTENLEKLQGMAATVGGQNPYEELMELIYKHDKIQVWYEY